MRTTCSTAVTKILPSPILPVLAALTIASTQRSVSSDFTTTSTFTLGRKSTTYSAPRYSSVWPFWRPKPFTSVTVRPVTPHSASASRTSSSLNGLTMAVICFIEISLFSWGQSTFAAQSGLTHKVSGSKAVGNRITPILAEAPMGHPNPDWRLAALVFIQLDQPRHLLHVRLGKTRRHNRGNALVVFHIAVDDGIQHLVGREAILVGLVGAQLGTG